ncbi:WD and tetratricopeptide repeats protein 1-like, partial [Trifolium medium]|nr:WD and tetratricopeptide repeats protein 1-like [Trifolium medium]
EYIACGSDDGMLYIFEKRSAKLISRCLGHKYGVICVQSHPTELAIATSGFGILDPNDEIAMVASGIGAVDPNNEYVEELVKIWTPDSVDNMALTENDLQCMEENQMYAREGLRQNDL